MSSHVFVFEATHAELKKSTLFLNLEYIYYSYLNRFIINKDIYVFQFSVAYINRILYQIQQNIQFRIIPVMHMNVL